MAWFDKALGHTLARVRATDICFLGNGRLLSFSCIVSQKAQGSPSADSSAWFCSLRCWSCAALLRPLCFAGLSWPWCARSIEPQTSTRPLSEPTVRQSPFLIRFMCHFFGAMPAGTHFEKEFSSPTQATAKPDFFCFVGVQVGGGRVCGMD